MPLRQATLEDVAAMHALRMSVRENRLSDPLRVTEADYVPFLAQCRASWVAECEGRLVGFAIANLEARSVWALFVTPDSERRGVGRALLQRVTDALLQSGPEPISLVTEPGTRAEQLYLAAGWTRVGVEPSGEIRFERGSPSAV